MYERKLIRDTCLHMSFFAKIKLEAGLQCFEKRRNKLIQLHFSSGELPANDSLTWREVASVLIAAMEEARKTLDEKLHSRLHRNELNTQFRALL